MTFKKYFLSLFSVVALVVAAVVVVVGAEWSKEVPLI